MKDKKYPFDLKGDRSVARHAIDKIRPVVEGYYRAMGEDIPLGCSWFDLAADIIKENTPRNMDDKSQ